MEEFEGNTLYTKKEIKKERKHALDMESDQKRKKTKTVAKKEKTRSRPRKRLRNKENTFIFS